MLMIIYVLILLAALAELFVFGGSIIPTLAVILLCVTFLGLKLFVKQKMPKNLMFCFTVLGIVLLIVFGVKVGIRGSEGGILQYSDRLQQATEYLAEGQYDKAAQELESMEEEFGTADGTYILSAIRCLEKGDVLKAKEAYNQIENKKQKVSYALLEQIYMQDYSEDSTQNLYRLYIEAANEHPTWSYMQLWAGVTQFEQGNHKGAEYYLLAAYNLDDSNPTTLYYLGAVKYAQNEWEEAKEFFNASVEAGANDTLCSYIAWYLQEMNY